MNKFQLEYQRDTGLNPEILEAGEYDELELEQEFYSEDYVKWIEEKLSEFI